MRQSKTNKWSFQPWGIGDKIPGQDKPSMVEKISNSGYWNPKTKKWDQEGVEVSPGQGKRADDRGLEPVKMENTRKTEVARRIQMATAGDTAEARVKALLKADKKEKGEPLEYADLDDEGNVVKKKL